MNPDRQPDEPPPVQELNLDEIDADLAEASGVIDNPDAPYNWAALSALRTAEKLRAALHQVAAELAEHQQLFELQWRRMGEATALWRAEDPDKRALIQPDLGTLLKWLMDKAAAAERGRQMAELGAASLEVALNDMLADRRTTGEATDDG